MGALFSWFSRTQSEDAIQVAGADETPGAHSQDEKKRGHAKKDKDHHRQQQKKISAKELDDAHKLKLNKRDGSHTLLV